MTLTRYGLVFCGFLFLMPAARGQSTNAANVSPQHPGVAPAVAVANEEDVRRIVERAMAAVALAEAQTNRSIAEMQIKLNERESELARIRAENGKITSETNSQLVAKVEGLKAELVRAQSMLEDARSALKAWQARNETMSDSIARLSAILQKTTTEKSELGERLDAAQTRASLLEESLQQATISGQIVPADTRSNILEEELAHAREEATLAHAEIARAQTMAGDHAGGQQGMADSMAFIAAERERFAATAQELREKNQTLLNRSRVIEDALREQTSLADTAGVLRLAAAKAAADSLAAVAAELAVASAERNHLQAKTGPLEQKNVELEDARVRLDAALVAVRLEKAGDEAELSSARREGEIFAARLNAMQSERDSLATELLANRREIIDAMRAVNDNSAAIKSLRAERDAVVALARSGDLSAPVEAASLTEALRKNVEYERELASLRRLFSASLAVESSWPGSSVPAPPVAAATAIAVSTAGPTVAPSLDLNTASFDALAAVIEIGPTRARAIVWYRENIGPIKNEDDLKSVPGFNDERIRSLKVLWRP